ncbi:MAG: N-6 DNA methylase [Clostridia bacterium]|nr:N-6 DNA methylase [Clostridia bacterium]
MMESKEIKKWMWDLATAMQGALYSKDVGFSMVRLVFLKYATDNCLGAMSMDEMQSYMQLQRTFSARDIEGGPNSVWPVLLTIDKNYNLNGLLRASMSDYERELFGLDDNRNFRNSASLNAFKRIIDALSYANLTEDAEPFIKGKMIVNELIEMLKGQGDSAKFPYWSKKEVGEIAKNILSVSENETFLDFASGVGSTTITIVGDTKCKIKCNEVNAKVATISSMLYIMQGYRDFVVESFDSFAPYIEEYAEIPEDEKADKIFVDSPMGLKVKESPLKESSLIGLCQAVNKLKENGMAILTVAPSVLSGAGKSQEIRKLLIESGYIQSVIALPLTCPNSTITTNMVVVSKKKNDGIMFVNACVDEFKQYILSSSKVRGGTTISEEGIELLSKIVNDNIEVKSISKFIAFTDVDSKSYDLSPLFHITQTIEVEDITVKEIDVELNVLYEKLKNLIK